MFRAFGLSALIVSFLCGAADVQAATPLRMAQVDTENYPLLVLDASGQATGGLLKDLGDELAEQLGTTAQHLTFSRKRLEDSVESGAADIGCYLSPRWSDRYSKNGLWTIATFPQIERVVVAVDKPMPKTVPGDFARKTVALMLGYHYARIQPLFDQKRATRQDFTRVDQLFRAVDKGQADVLISSEPEILGYLDAHLAMRSRFKVSEDNFTVVKTQCLVSPKSPWHLAKINVALQKMLDDGSLERLAKRYGMSMQ